MTRRSVRLEALASPTKSAFATGPFGSAVSAANFRSDGVPMLRGSNLSGDLGVRLDESELVYLDSDLAANFSRSRVTHGDLIFTCWGTVGQIGYIDSRARCAEYIVSNKQMKMSPDPRQVDGLFLYYYLSQPRMLDLVKAQAIGSSVPGFNLGQLKALPIELPPLNQQRAIADALGALDDRIAANAGLSRTIDNLVAARFKQLTDASNEWVSLADVAAVNAFVVKPRPGAHLRYVDISSVGVGSYEFPELSQWEDAPSRARRALRHGDTLWSTVRPNRRSHALNLSTDETLVASTGLAVLSPTTVGFAYLYEVTRRAEFTAYLESVAEGSAYPAVRAERFGEAMVPLAEATAREAFEADASALRELGAARSMESRQLSEVRDTLLPELMSGRLRVKDAERVVGEVV